MENDKTVTGLHFYLQGLAIDDLCFYFLATDYCIYYSALDAKEMGFNTFFILDAYRGVDVSSGNIAAAIQVIKQQGTHILKHDDLMF
jgi:nicotinamidase/pyrazinamidase